MVQHAPGIKIRHPAPEQPKGAKPNQKQGEHDRTAADLSSTIGHDRPLLLYFYAQGAKNVPPGQGTSLGRSARLVNRTKLNQCVLESS